MREIDCGHDRQLTSGLAEINQWSRQERSVQRLSMTAILCTFVD